ncbi:HU family DNA-binding protein [Mycoplasma sp. 653B]|uniref:HU family DNA-binding protein n=1 Tax=Mycoplasma sp. 653B TaxID=3401677 RepID=UPI003AAC0823
MERNKNMTKKEFINEVSERSEFTPKDVEKVFDAMVFVLKEQLIMEEKVRLSHLGIFSTSIKPARTMSNKFKKSAGEPDYIEVPQRRVVKYTPSKYLRDLVDFKA